MNLFLYLLDVAGPPIVIVERVFIIIMIGIAVVLAVVAVVLLRSIKK